MILWPLAFLCSLVGIMRNERGYRGVGQYPPPQAVEIFLQRQFLPPQWGSGCFAGIGWKRAPARDDNHADNNFNDNNGFRVVLGAAPRRSPHALLGAWPRILRRLRLAQRGTIAGATASRPSPMDHFSPPRCRGKLTVGCIGRANIEPGPHPTRIQRYGRAGVVPTPTNIPWCDKD